MCYKMVRSKTSYRGKGSPTKGKKKQVAIKKPDRKVPGVGLDWDGDATSLEQQLSGNYKKPALRSKGNTDPAPMRVATTVLG